MPYRDRHAAGHGHRRHLHARSGRASAAHLVLQASWAGSAGRSTPKGTGSSCGNHRPAAESAPRLVRVQSQLP